MPRFLFITHHLKVVGKEGKSFLKKQDRFMTHTILGCVKLNKGCIKVWRKIKPPSFCEEAQRKTINKGDIVDKSPGKQTFT